MKLLVLTLFIVSFLFSSSRELPPVPSIGYKEMKKKALRECRVPPQIAILPPQIDKDYRECVNNYYAPNPQTAEMNLKTLGYLKKEDKLLSINKAPGLVRVYEFSYETNGEKDFLGFSKEKAKKILLCDDSLNNCYKAVKLVKIKKK